MRKDGVEHKDLGVTYFDKRSTDIKAKRLVSNWPSSDTRSSYRPWWSSMRPIRRSRRLARLIEPITGERLVSA